MTLRTETFEQAHPTGLLITRLPIGYAADHWWVYFVLSNTAKAMESIAVEGERFFFYRSLVTVVAPHQGAVLAPGGGYDGDIAELHFRVASPRSLPALEVTYQYNGVQLAREEVDLS